MLIRPPRRRYLRGIGYASLTDIVLLLLIFFLLSSSFVLRPGLRIRLPAGTQSEETVSSPITVTLEASGRIFVDQTEVDGFEGLAMALRRRLASGATPTLVLEADRDMALRHAVRVLDMAREAGLENLVLATEVVQDAR
jgi:biopolymer transport protein ExbD